MGEPDVLVLLTSSWPGLLVFRHSSPGLCTPARDCRRVTVAVRHACHGQQEGGRVGTHERGLVRWAFIRRHVESMARRCCWRWVVDQLLG